MECKHPSSIEMNVIHSIRNHQIEQTALKFPLVLCFQYSTQNQWCSILHVSDLWSENFFIYAWLEIVFISPNQFYKFSSKYNLVHHNSMTFITVMKGTLQIHLIITLSPKTCCCGNNMMHSVVHSNLESIVSFGKWVGEIFPTLCYMQMLSGMILKIPKL